MRRTFLGDGTNEDVVLEKAKDINVYVQMIYNSNVYSSENRIYLDDPENPVLSGSIMNLTFKALFIVATLAFSYF